MISKRKISDLIIVVLISLLMAPFPPRAARAHRVSVFAYTGEGKVFVEGYFPDGSKAAGAKVEVYNPRGQLVFEGLTDGRGSLSFPIPPADDLTIFVTAAGGHKSSFALSREKPAGTSHGLAAGHTHDDAGRTGQETHPVVEGEGTEDVHYARDLERTLDRKLEPVMEVLLDIRRKMDRPAMKDVIAGLGYVAGIAGLLFFIQGRRKKRE